MDITLKKPLIGEPCNQCGLCCQLHICHTGAYLLGKTKYIGERRIPGPCPVLTPTGNGTFACGFVIDPVKWMGKSKYRPEVISRSMKQRIGAGTGCDEIGYDEGNLVEEKKLDDMIEKIKTDPQWKELTTKAVNILMKVKEG